MTPDDAWRDPQIITASKPTFTANYHVSGTIDRKFHLKVNGINSSGGTSTYTYQTDINSSTMDLTFTSAGVSQDYGLTKHGIRTCEAWLTAGNSEAGLLESDHVITRIMVVQENDINAMKPALLISEMKETVENFVQTKLLS